MSRLREHREAAGLTQADLAKRAGVSRQLIGAAESGRNLPRVDAAVALAGALQVAVEEIFAADTGPVDVLTGSAPEEGVLLRAGRVGRRIVVVPLHAGGEGWGTGDGLIEQGRFIPFAGRRDGLVVAGCEPALEVLEHSLRQVGAAALSVTASSAAAIEALRTGRVHAAVVHGPALRRADELPGVVRIRLASWEVGLADARDAEPGWFEAALSGRSPVVQREPGAGVQQTFEEHLASGAPVPGPRVRSHIDAARRAVYGGIPAVTIAPAALAAGAVFRPLGFHETQLWIDPQWAEEDVVAEALEVLQSRPFRLRLEQIGGYDLSGFATSVA